MIIGQDYKIEMPDELNIGLYHRLINQRGNHIGEERWQLVGYYSPNLVGFKCALEKLRMLKVAETNLIDFTKVIEKIGESDKLIQSIDFSSPSLKS